MCVRARNHPWSRQATGIAREVKDGATNGATREEIREVFMQVAIYCGVPAGVDAFRNAKEVFAELGKK